ARPPHARGARRLPPLPARPGRLAGLIPRQRSEMLARRSPPPGQAPGRAPREQRDMPTTRDPSPPGLIASGLEMTAAVCLPRSAEVAPKDAPDESVTGRGIGSHWLKNATTDWP